MLGNRIVKHIPRKCGQYSPKIKVKTLELMRTYDVGYNEIQKSSGALNLLGSSNSEYVARDNKEKSIRISR